MLLFYHIQHPRLHIVLTHILRVEVPYLPPHKTTEVPQVIPVGLHRPRRVFALNGNIIQEMLNHGAKVQKFSDIRKKKSENWGKNLPPVGNLPPVAILGGVIKK